MLAGRSVYLREEEIMLIHLLSRDSFKEFRQTPELEKIRKEVESKMNAALYAIETK